MVPAALALAILAGVLGAGVASRLNVTGPDDPASDSVRTRDALSHASGLESQPRVAVLIRGRSRAKVQRVAAVVGADRGIARVVTPYAGGTRDMISRDGRLAYLAAWLRRTADDAATVKRLRAALGARRDVLVGGGAAVGEEINATVGRDLARAELVAFPLLFGLALWFFRGLVAALLPPLVGGLAIAFTLLALRLASEAMTISVFALNIVTGLGLGMAIDCSLFVVSRYREELARHGPGREALRATLTTAGRTVLFSSLTVAAALSSLLVFPQSYLRSMGLGGVIVALLAAAVVLLVLPSILALLGERVNALSPAALRRTAETQARAVTDGPWYRLSRLVMRRPARVAAVSAALLVAAGVPFAGIRFIPVDSRVLPRSADARQVDDALRMRFALNRTSPVTVAAWAPAGPGVTRFARRLRGLPGVAVVAAPRPVSRRLTRIDVVTWAGPYSAESQRLIGAIRAQPAPFRIGVTGSTASFVDLKTSLGDHIPLGLAIVASATVAVLFLMTGSVVLPLKALLMSVLTISAAFGLLVLIFQDGSFLGSAGGALETTQPVLLFALAFGISTDYGVFLLSRIKEAHDAGVPNREAVAVGLERTGRIVTAAAVLFCVAMGAFATSRVLLIREITVGTALAILIDATIVRALLVPSLMALLGRWNWWAPAPLRRLHRRIGIAETAPGATPALRT